MIRFTPSLICLLAYAGAAGGVAQPPGWAQIGQITEFAMSRRSGIEITLALAELPEKKTLESAVGGATADRETWLKQARLQARGRLNESAPGRSLAAPADAIEMLFRLLLAQHSGLAAVSQRVQFQVLNSDPVVGKDSRTMSWLLAQAGSIWTRVLRHPQRPEYVAACKALLGVACESPMMQQRLRIRSKRMYSKKGATAALDFAAAVQRVIELLNVGPATGSANDTAAAWQGLGQFAAARYRDQKGWRRLGTNGRQWLEALLLFAANLERVPTPDGFVLQTSLLQLAELDAFDRSAPSRLEAKTRQALVHAVREFVRRNQDVLQDQDTAWPNWILSTAASLGVSKPGTGSATGQLQKWQSLADAHAALMLNDVVLSDYYRQPFRSSFVDDLGSCLRDGALPDQYPGVPVSASTYRQCLKVLSDWALLGSASAEAAGNAEGPFAEINLRREFALPMWQRIRYFGGLLVDADRENCQMETDSLSNVLEWSLATRAVVWWMRRWPSYATNTRILERLAARGRLINQALARISICGHSTGTYVDNLEPILKRYRGALAGFARSVEKWRVDFRQRHLRPGADIDLNAADTPTTEYAPQNALIAACDVRSSCDVDIELTPTRALFGLFANPYRLADQLGLGSLSLCYSHVEWRQRRREPGA